LKKRRDFFVNEGDEFVRGERNGLRVGGATDETGEEGMTVRGAAWEER
jgi:hypothetical protein